MGHHVRVSIGVDFDVADSEAVAQVSRDAPRPITSAGTGFAQEVDVEVGRDGKSDRSDRAPRTQAYIARSAEREDRGAGDRSAWTQQAGRL